jgi:uncharacterized protein YbbC (DUF1343 family)
MFLIAFWSATAQHPAVKPGIDVLREGGFEVLEGKRVGLITNQSGVDAHLRSTIDILHTAPEVDLVALFGPEHGVRGDHPGGEKIGFYTDPETGLPVYSLYGMRRSPTEEMLSGIDALVYYIQDIGCRSYTYIGTMGRAMRAAAEYDIGFVVLDRPNPLGGKRVEGSLVDSGYTSMVSQYPIPYVYGLTCGELARLINEEGMLGEDVLCDLKVVPMTGWDRSMIFEETGLSWVPTSPHIPEARSALYYVSTGIMGELYTINHGVGYTIPFQTFAAEWIDPAELCDRANSLELEGVLFRPVTYRPYYGKEKGKTLHGVQIHIVDPSTVELMSLQFHLMQVHHELYPAKNPFAIADTLRWRTFDRVCGNSRVRELFTERMVYEDVRGFLEKDIQEFLTLKQKYHLY